MKFGSAFDVLQTRAKSQTHREQIFDTRTYFWHEIQTILFLNSQQNRNLGYYKSRSCLNLKVRTTNKSEFETN